MVLLKKQLIMRIGLTQNNWELTEQMVRNSLETFRGVPIVWNQKEEFKDYSGDMKDYKKEKVIGMVLVDGDIIIEENKVYADIILLHDEYRYLWKGKFDNWCILLNEDGSAFKLYSIEVF